MQEHEWNLQFWTTGHAPAEHRGVFGCSSHGLCAEGAWTEPETPAVRSWGPALEGNALCGTFAHVAASLARLDFSPALLLVFSAVGSGVEGFLEQVRVLCPGAPVAGGCAARQADTGELIPGAPEVALLAVRSGAFEVEWHNLLDPDCPLSFAASGARKVKSLQVEPGGALQPALAAFSELQRLHGKSSSDHESMTLCDLSGRNLHFHPEGDLLVAGADLPDAESLLLCTAAPALIASRMESLLAVPGTLLLGCAGLRMTLPRPLASAPGSLGAFLFGEIGPLQEAPAFGNLMATTVRRVSS